MRGYIQVQYGDKHPYRQYNSYRHKVTGTRYHWVDLTNVDTGLVQVCTEAQSIYLVSFKNIERIDYV